LHSRSNSNRSLVVVEVPVPLKRSNSKSKKYMDESLTEMSGSTSKRLVKESELESIDKSAIDVAKVGEKSTKRKGKGKKVFSEEESQVESQAESVVIVEVEDKRPKGGRKQAETVKDVEGSMTSAIGRSR
jgi:hypothetical protein